jgi:NAD-dependent dihydropyrimidine dehydrogenase PreA subunit
MQVQRKIIEINEDLCNGCGQCVRACAEGAIQMVNGKARLVSETYCDGLGACIGDCPTGALKVVERMADSFDENAVHQHLQQLAHHGQGGCPSAQAMTFTPPAASAASDPPAESSLGHWPVQIRLVHGAAPFLQDADITVAADCVPVAYPAFQRDFVAGKVVMIGCPKFDDPMPYLDRFVDIFTRNNVRSVMVVVMEVPCCQGLPAIVERAREMVGADVPIEKVIVSRDGRILSRELFSGTANKSGASIR